MSSLRSGRGGWIGRAFVSLGPVLGVWLVVAAAGQSALLARSWSEIVSAVGFRPDQVGLVVLDESGATQASLGADAPLAPASNQKLLVVAAALKTLGPGFAYETTLWARAAPREGEIHGDLIVSGNGDPNISGRFTGGDPLAIFRGWAAEFRAKGVQRIRGDLLVDDFAFDDERFLSSWKSDQWSRWYSAQIGALSFNDNCVDVAVIPASVGGLARYRLSPATAYVTIENTCETVGLTKSTRVPQIGLDRVRDTNRVLLRGRIAARENGEWEGPVTVDDPGLYFGTVLAEVFEREGIRIDGRVARDRSRVPPPSERVLYHRHRSPLRLDLPVILENSQNLHAENLLKALGHASGAQGSVASGASVVLQRLRDYGIGVEGVRIADGSGLSPDNRVTAGVLAALLGRVAREPWFELFRDSLPVGGKSGTLSRRFRSSKLRGHVVAKTGFIRGVSALSGYVYRDEREPVEGGAAASGSATALPVAESRPWTFALLVNGFPRGRGADAAFELQEAVVAEILRRMR